MLNTTDKLDVTLYRTGRLHVHAIRQPTLTQKALILSFKKGLKNGKFNSMRPGNYEFRFVKIGRFNTEAELTLIED
jgi:hypothetical protein